MSLVPTSAKEHGVVVTFRHVRGGAKSLPTLHSTGSAPIVLTSSVYIRLHHLPDALLGPLLLHSSASQAC